MTASSRATWERCSLGAGRRARRRLLDCLGRACRWALGACRLPAAAAGSLGARGPWCACWRCSCGRGEPASTPFRRCKPRGCRSLARVPAELRSSRALTAHLHSLTTLHLLAAGATTCCTCGGRQRSKKRHEGGSWQQQQRSPLPSAALAALVSSFLSHSCPLSVPLVSESAPPVLLLPILLRSSSPASLVDPSPAASRAADP